MTREVEPKTFDKAWNHLNEESLSKLFEAKNGILRYDKKSGMAKDIQET